MNRRVLLSGLLVVVCLATLWGVWGQRSQLAGLRAEQQQLQAQLAAKADGAASPGTAEATGASSGTARPALMATPELLRLRNEVTRLTGRRRELASARADNERLRAQLASRGTNGPAGFQLPPGYMLKGEARFVGYSTPDDTIQSLLWAVQNHDLRSVLQAFTPEKAEFLRAATVKSPESAEDLWSLGGLRIVSREQDASDGSINVETEVVPGEDGPRWTFRQVNGQWKIAGHAGEP